MKGCRTGSETEDNPSNAQDFSADRTIAAEKIAWLCTDPLASRFVTYLGIRLQGVRIDGPLCLDGARIRFPLFFVKCAFPNDIFLNQAELQVLSLEASRVKTIWANEFKTKGDVLLRNGFIADGQVSLSAAKIGGDLDCDNAHIANTNGIALDAHGAKIEGSVFLRKGFKAEGQVNFVGASIGGPLDCGNAQIANTNDVALDAHSAKIEGSVFLQEGFKAEGQVNFAGATIGGDLRCIGAQILIAKNRDHMRFTKRFYGDWWWYGFFGKPIDYGYCPWRALGWSVKFILASAILFKLGHWKRVITPTSESAYFASGPPQLRESYSLKFNSLVYSFESFVPLINFRLAEYWLPNANCGTVLVKSRFGILRWGGVLRFWLWVHTCVGWVLTTLLVGALEQFHKSYSVTGM